MTDPLGLINTGASGLQALRPAGASGSGAAVGGPSFKDVLLKNLEQVNQLQQDAQTAIEDLAAGKRDDVGSVMLAKQKADLAFQMLLQVRNKLLDAYTEIQQIRV